MCIFLPQVYKPKRKEKSESTNFFHPLKTRLTFLTPLPAMYKNVGSPKNQKFNLHFPNKHILLYTTFSGLKTSWYQITQDARSPAFFAWESPVYKSYTVFTVLYQTPYAPQND